MEKGNLFPNLYEGYANYKVREPVARTDKEAMLLEIQKLDFAINELNLYLDLHPEDKYAYYLFKDYTVEKTKKEANYTNIYGPLAFTDLGEECELSLDYISEIESLKRRKSFSLAVLGRIADTLEIDIKEFFNKNNS